MLGETISRGLDSQWVAQLELPLVVVNVAWIEIVMGEGFSLQVSQSIDEGLHEKDCLRLWEMHGGVVT